MKIYELLLGLEIRAEIFYAIIRGKKQSGWTALSVRSVDIIRFIDLFRAILLRKNYSNSSSYNRLNKYVEEIKYHKKEVL